MKRKFHNVYVVNQFAIHPKDTFFFRYKKDAENFIKKENLKSKKIHFVRLYKFWDYHISGKNTYDTIRKKNKDFTQKSEPLTENYMKLWEVYWKGYT